jgi:hypothetical protein
LRGGALDGFVQHTGRDPTRQRQALFLVGIGIGLLIELTAGVLMFGAWLLGVWAT